MDLALPQSQPNSPARRQRAATFFVPPLARTHGPVPGVKLRQRFGAARAPLSPNALPVGHRSRYMQPVPPPQPNDLQPRRRGRNARKRAHQAEHFRHYLWLRRQLKPWSDAFRAKYGRTPTLVDVHRADVPGLLDRFVEYLEALDNLRSFTNS